MTAIPIVTANGARIPAIGFGTWPMKGAVCEAAVACALEAGYRHIDTAAMYGNEVEVGAAIRASGVPRDGLFVTSKVWYDQLGPGHFEAAAADCVKRLDIGIPDLLLIHWPDTAMPVAQMMAGLAAAKAAGLCSHVGVSNFPPAMLREAVAAMARLDGPKLVANQCEYHPELDQSATLAACREAGAAFVSYAPLGKGTLLNAPVLAAIAEAHGKTVAQVILRWHIQQPGVVAIPKSATPERIRANLAIGDFSLSDAEMTAIHALAHAGGRQVTPAWAPEFG